MSAELQPLDGEKMEYATQDGARLDIAANASRVGVMREWYSSVRPLQLIIFPNV